MPANHNTPHSDKSKKQMSESHKGCIPWNKGIPCSEEQKVKISKTSVGQHHSPNTEFTRERVLGENNYNWHGGAKISNMRQRNKRRELGSECLNRPNIGLEGHHINMEQIVYIPKEINHFYYHNVRTGKNMGIINYLALLWLITSGEINNCNI